MNIQEFARAADLVHKSELEKVLLLAFYFHKMEAKSVFLPADIVDWFGRLNYSQPNMSRLVGRLRQSRQFVRGPSASSFKLHAIELDSLQLAHPGLRTENEEIISDDTILPKPIYESTRGFVESLAKQINAAYEYNIFDGCAVLMRRLLEVLLILSYEHLGIEMEIQDKQRNYFPLEPVMNL